CVRTRRGRIVTESVPELRGLAEEVPRGTVLDGELVAGQGRASDFYRLGPQMARRRRPPQGLTFVAFDVLHLAGQQVTGLAWAQRRQLLEVLELNGAAWCTVPTFDSDPQVVLEACAHHELEGLVAKRTDAIYEPGRRSRCWVKMKTADWRHLHADRRHEPVRRN
ncbi:MAG TPA: RNA ligase family protein, partial [Acidimicrobiales bacterium]|nr:RNA ligase family protein [Acidimicrobiales bacterium]